MASNTTNLNLYKKDPTVDGNDTFNIKTMLNDNWDKIDAAIIGKANKVDFSSHLADNLYQTAGGTATAITLTISGTLVTGYPITFIASANNNGAATTINGKTLYKPGTTTSPNLIAGKAYTVWYNATNNCFFIKASAEGTATTPQVLAGVPFSNENDTGLIGTMPNYTSQNVQSGAPWNNGTTLYFPIDSGGYYPGGGNSGVYRTDSNFIPANILSGKSIFGVAGSATVESLGGKRYASGTGQVYGDGTFTYSGSYTGSRFSFTVTGLPFTPRVITVYATVTLKDSVGGNPWVMFNSWIKDPLTFPNGGKSTNITQMENSDMRITADGFYWFSAITLNVDAITNPRYYFTNNSVTWHAWG